VTNIPTITYTPVVRDDEAQQTLEEVYDQILLWMEEDDRRALAARVAHGERDYGSAQGEDAGDGRIARAV